MPKHAAAPPTAAPPSPPIAVIDVGSDTIHLVIAAVVPPKDGAKDGAKDDLKLRTIARRSELIELGREVAAKGRIGRAKVDELSALARAYAARARRNGATLVLAATEAIREAANGEAVLDRLSREVDAPVRLLSGEVEAELSFLGARAWMEAEGVQLFIDSGGASTEVVIAEGRTLRSKVSVAVGAASLAQGLRGDPPRPLAFGLAGVRIGELLAQLPEGKPVRAYATGGSAHNLAQIDTRSPRQKRMTLIQLDVRTKELMTLPAAKLARRAGAGLREGIALASRRSPEGWWQAGA